MTDSHFAFVLGEVAHTNNCNTRRSVDPSRPGLHQASQGYSEGLSQTTNTQTI